MRRWLSLSACQIARNCATKSSKTGSAAFAIFVSDLPCLRSALLGQRPAFDGAATQQTALSFRKVLAGVDRASVVPHQEIAQLPDVLENEFGPLADLVELIEDR